MRHIKQGDFKIFFHTIRCSDEVPVLPPLIVHHGLAQSMADWEDAGWCEAFGNRSVIAIDALGHGRSDRPGSRESYSIEKRAEAVVDVADAMGIDRFAFFGFSMGGRVGFELALRHPSRVEQLVIGGMHGLNPSIDRQNLERRIAVLRSNKWRLVERAVGAHKREQNNNTAEALALSTEAVLDWQGADDRLPGLEAPTLMYCGEQDSLLEYARQTASLIPNCEFTELATTGHAASFYSSEQAKELVNRFLE